MQIASGSEYDIISMPKKWKIVLCEEGILYLAEVQLHDLVKEVLCWRCILFRDTFCVKILVASSYVLCKLLLCMLEDKPETTQQDCEWIEWYGHGISVSPTLPSNEADASSRNCVSDLLYYPWCLQSDRYVLSRIYMHMIWPWVGFLVPMWGHHVADILL